MGWEFDWPEEPDLDVKDPDDGVASGKHASMFAAEQCVIETAMEPDVFIDLDAEDVEAEMEANVEHEQLEHEQVGLEDEEEHDGEEVGQEQDPEEGFGAELESDVELNFGGGQSQVLQQDRAEEAAPGADADTDELEVEVDEELLEQEMQPTLSSLEFDMDEANASRTPGEQDTEYPVSVEQEVDLMEHATEEWASGHDEHYNIGDEQHEEVQAADETNTDQPELNNCNEATSYELSYAASISVGETSELFVSLDSAIEIDADFYCEDASPDVGDDLAFADVVVDDVAATAQGVAQEDDNDAMLQDDAEAACCRSGVPLPATPPRALHDEDPGDDWFAAAEDELGRAEDGADFQDVDLSLKRPLSDGFDEFTEQQSGEYEKRTLSDASPSSTTKRLCRGLVATES